MSLPAFRLVTAFFAAFSLGIARYAFEKSQQKPLATRTAFSLGIARYAFEKSQQKPLATRTEIKQSLMTDLG